MPHPTSTLQQTDLSQLRDMVQRSDKITSFQRKVYLELLTIPAGTTISYGELARRIGCRSAQAVGQALRRNPFAPDVPCHRVVAADGSLGGYNGERDGEQLERKRQLLESEHDVKL
ncbi:MAG: MGMT family protein [Alistipes sp.]|nr:MGMT family protein [Alistipes sp.]